MGGMTPKHDLEFANQKQKRNTFQEEDSLCTQVGRSRDSRGVCESNLNFEISSTTGRNECRWRESFGSEKTEM